MAEPINGDDLLARVQPKLKEFRTQLCLRPDLIQKWEAANERLAEVTASGATNTRLAGDGPSSQAKKIAREVQAIEQEIEDASAWFEFRALPVAEYQALLVKHPPRKDNQMDMLVGYDRDGFSDALVRACLVDPVFSDEGWKAFMATCAPSEWAELRSAVNEVNGGEVAPPKSPLASRVLARRGSASA